MSTTILPAGAAWALEPKTLSALVAALSEPEASRPDRAQLAARLGVRTSAGSRPSPAAGVAVIPVYGIIVQRASFLSDFFGGTSTEEIGAMLEAAMASADVGTIVLDVDSPGGTVYGVPELAAQIFAARAVKRIVASCSGMCCSAAYWLASAADEITASPSSEVGSIGVYSAHVDTSAAQSQAGMKVSIFSAGKYKAEGAMGQPLSEGARAAEQARVDEMYGVFVADVARGRGTDSTRVRSGFGEGRVVSSQRAVTLGMIDRVATLAATIGRFRRPNRSTGTGANAETLRRQLALNVAKTSMGSSTPTPPPTGANAATLLRKLRLDTAKVAR